MGTDATIMTAGLIYLPKTTPFFRIGYSVTCVLRHHTEEKNLYCSLYVSKINIILKNFALELRFCTILPFDRYADRPSYQLSKRGVVSCLTL